jgi:phosphoglycerol transferase MdoB-like AlkP superfamily enzyme
MTDQTAGYLPGDLRFAKSRSSVRRLLEALTLSPRTAAGLALMIALALGWYFWLKEGPPSNIVFTAAVTLASAAVLTLLSRRVLFAAVVMGAFVTLIVTLSNFKRATMNMVMHAYDFVFYLSSWSTFNFLWADHRGYVLALLGALAATAVTGWIAWRIDGSRIPRRQSAFFLVAFVLVAWVGATLKGERRHMQFQFDALYVSSFYSSWAETLETFWRGQMLEAAPSGSGGGFTLPTTCEMSAKPPHIILIHEESLVPPGLFPTLRYDKSVDGLYVSQDGATHLLRVETYGGASWLTEFSILTGVSTHAYGGMRQFVQTFMRNKLKDTLPQALLRCGYRNVVFYPLLKNFVSNDKFYTSIGLKEIFDAKAQGAKRANERDRFYYMNALAEMQRHFKTSDQPLFTFIQTMATHWPYDVTYEPQVMVPGGGPGTHPEMHEYLRRVSMAKRDYDEFVAELERRFPGERFLLVHYGDHHPTSTRMLLGFKEDVEAEDVALDPESIGFLTYYVVDGINYRVPPLPDFDALDVPYLGTLILDAAGLPLSDAHRERKRLMMLCQGRYNSCAKRDEILAFHRRLIDSGLLIAR